MIQIIRQPGGAWENIGGTKGRQLWRNQNGRRTLTQYGRQTLANFQDLTIHIPAIERGFPTADHPAPRDREVWYPISENSLPGMIEKLQDEVPLAFVNRLEDLTTLPPAFKNWVLSQMDPDNEGLLDEGSDRYWEPDDTRSWFMSVQHVEVDAAGRAHLRTDLADRPMLGHSLVYWDIPFHWHLSAVASCEKDCVPLSLAQALGLDFQETKKRLCEISDSKEGFLRRDVLSFLEQVSEETGTKIGYKIFQNGEVVAQQYCEKNGPFISFFQKANHLYLYGVRAPVNAFHAKKKNIFIGIRQHLRSLSNVPQELRTKSLDFSGSSNC